MLRLDSTEPKWLELFPALGGEPAVEVQFAPIAVPDVRAARRALADAFDHDPEDTVAAGDALSRELIRRGLRDWRGVGGLDGKPLDPADPAHVAAFLNDHRTFEAADRMYVVPWLHRDAEGNGWSASPNGTGEAEMRAADIVSSAAELESAGDAAPAMTDRAVPTGSTSRKRKKASASGT